MFWFAYWAPILGCDSAVSMQSKKNSMTSNGLPLHFSPSQASSSQNSNFDSNLQYFEVETNLIWVIFNSGFDCTLLSNIVDRKVMNGQTRTNAKKWPIPTCCHDQWRQDRIFCKQEKSRKTRFKTNPKPLDKCFFGLEQVQTSLIDLLQVSTCSKRS